MFVVYGWVCLNINHIFMTSFFLIYIVADIVRVYFTFQDVIMDFILLIVALSLAVSILNYNREKFSKQFFLQQKKIKALNFEQQEIFRKLPDGVLIHKFVKSEN